MINDHAKIFKDMMISTAEIYNRSISPGLINIYWRSLEQYSINEVINAFERHLSNPDNGMFMPKPADIIRLLEGTSLTNAMLAWSKVEKAIHQIGPHKSIVFDDPIIHQVLDDMGGWIDLCSHNQKEMEFKSNEFTKRFISLKTSPRDYYVKSLKGLADVHNNAEGFASSSPYLFGNKEKAEQVYIGGHKNISEIHQLTKKLKITSTTVNK